MKARIDARFATAEETARVLGVPNSRLKKLMRLADSLIPQNNGSRASYATSVTNGKSLQGNSNAAHARFKVPHSIGKTAHRKPKASKKLRSAHKRRARAKVAKAL